MPGNLGGVLNSGNGGKEFPRIGILGRLEDPLSRAVFDNLAGVHDRDVISKVADHRKVVRYENHGEVEFVPEGEKEVEDLRLDRDVQRGNRLVCKDEPRLGGQGAGDCNALSLTAREFVGILTHEAGVETDSLHEFTDLAREELPRGGEILVTLAQSLCQGAVDSHPGVQGRVGVLEHHLKIEALLANARWWECAQVLSFEQDFTRRGRL